MPVDPTSTTPINEVTVVTWPSETGTGNAFELGGTQGALGNVQFPGSTGTLEASNDATNWVTVSDVNGAAISGVAMAEFSTSARYIRPVIASGTVTPIVMLRG